MQLKFNVLQVLQNWSILFSDEAGQAFVSENGAQPETWNSKGNILDILYIADGNLKLLIVFIFVVFFELIEFIDQLLI